MNQFIYVVGGFDGTRQLASVERYDTENQVWDTVAPIKIARSALALTVLDGKLYAMGGFDGHSFLSIVELYDPTQDKWEESTSLTSGRSGHASAVIYQPSCANQYMDCVDDQVHRGKKPSPDDDESKPGPSNPGCGGGGGTSKPPSQSTTSSNQLHAFSGGRCTHCDDENTETNEEQTTTQRGNACSDNQSKYEQECRDAIYCLLRMDNDKQNIEEQNTNHKRIESQSSNDQMDISADEETNDYDSFNVDNPKKIRRKLDPESDESEEEEEEMGENSNSSCSSSNVIPDLRNRLKAKPNDSSQCSLSKLKNKVRQNICDFVTWSSSTPSSSSAIPLPIVIPQDSNSNNLSNKSNKSTSTEDRKCDLLRKYYKCKLKYCNTPK